MKYAFSTPEKEPNIPSVIWHYAQGMAMLSQNKTSDAKHPLQCFCIMAKYNLKALTI